VAAVSAVVEMVAVAAVVPARRRQLVELRDVVVARVLQGIADFLRDAGFG